MEHTTPDRGTAEEKRSKAIKYVAGAVLVFIVCSVVQAVGGSSMFSTQYVDPDNVLLDAAMNLTFWPGWVATIGLLLGAGAAMFDID